MIDNGFLISLTRVDIKNETDYNNFREYPIFLTASYACHSGFVFNVKDKPETKVISGQNISYLNQTCTDVDVWDRKLNCIKPV